MLPSIVELRGDPKGNLGARSAAISVADKVYAFGGFPRNPRSTKDPEDQITVSVFNTASLRWTTLTQVTTTGGKRPPEVPCDRYSHTAVLIGDTVYIWGGVVICGYYYMCYNIKLYAFDVDTHRWLNNTEVSGSVPAGNHGHSACALRKDMYVYGGYTNGGYKDDFYKLDTTSMVWSSIDKKGTLPLYSAGHSASIIGTKMFVFGGLGPGGAKYNTIRGFDTETGLWFSTPSSSQPLPEGCSRHSTFTYNGELYIYGGWTYWDGDDIANVDLWKFSPQTFSWKQLKLKVNDPFWVYEGCCCTVGDRVIIFGGANFIKRNVRPVDNVYILDFSPSLRTLCTLAVFQYGLEESGLPHNVSQELAAMTKSNLSYTPRRGQRHLSVDLSGQVAAAVPNG